MDLNYENLNDDELFSLLDEIKEQKEEKENVMFCKKCNSSDNLTEDTTQGIIVCMGCGEIVTLNIYDASLETRVYPDDGSSGVARCGTVTNHFLPQSSLGTSIGGSARSKIKLIHSWSAMPYKERSLHIVLKKIHSKCADAGILKCIEDDAKILYKNISESKHVYGKNKGKLIIIRGTNRTSLIASCVFFACKRKGVTRSPKEIAKLFDIKYKDMTKGYKLFLRMAKIKHLQQENKITNPEQFITRYCRELHIKDMFIEQAILIARNIQKLDLASSHTPFSVATSSILMMIEINQFKIDKKFLAKKFNVSDVTITKTYKKIEKYKDILINNELTEKLAKKIEEERQKIKMPEKLKGIYTDIKKEKAEIEKVNEEIDLKDLDMDSLLEEDDEDDEDVEKEDSDNVYHERNYYVDKFRLGIDDLDEYFDTMDTQLYEKLEHTEALYMELFSN